MKTGREEAYGQEEERSERNREEATGRIVQVPHLGGRIDLLAMADRGAGSRDVPQAIGTGRLCSNSGHRHRCKVVRSSTRYLLQIPMDIMVGDLSVGIRAIIVVGGTSMPALRAPGSKGRSSSTAAGWIWRTWTWSIRSCNRDFGSIWSSEATNCFVWTFDRWWRFCFGS